MAFFRVKSEGIHTGKDNILRNTTWIYKSFVSATRPSLKSKVDRETCEKVIKAAETMKEGTKEVVSEVKRIGQVLTDKIANTTGNVLADVAKKGFEKAAEKAGSQKSKDVMDTAKEAIEVFKKRLSDN